MSKNQEETDPRCCLGLTPSECAQIPENHCDGLQEVERRLPPEIGFFEYQSALFNIPFPAKDLDFYTIALCGEAGEFANKVKKRIRGDADGPTNLDLIDELGDILAYLTKTARELGYDLGSVAYRNISKLESRHARQTLTGTGDDR